MLISEISKSTLSLWIWSIQTQFKRMMMDPLMEFTKDKFVRYVTLTRRVVHCRAISSRMKLTKTIRSTPLANEDEDKEADLATQARINEAGPKEVVSPVSLFVRRHPRKSVQVVAVDILTSALAQVFKDVLNMLF